MKDKIYFDELRNLIQEKMEWEDWREWTHYNFVKLHESILAETNSVVSVTTLKRFFLKIYPNRTFIPNYQNRNVYCQFVGYANWEHFKNKYNEKHKKEVLDQKKNEYVRKRLKKVSKRALKVLSYAGIMAFIVYLSIFIIDYAQDYTRAEKLKNVTFHADYTPGTYPQNVQFHFSVPVLQDDEPFLIDLGTSGVAEKVTQYIIKDPQQDTLYNMLYNFPNTYYAELKKGEKTLRKIIIPILSGGWHRILKQESRKRIYLPNRDLHFTTSEEAVSNGIDTNNYYETLFQIVDTFDIRANNFTLSVQIQNNIVDNLTYCNINSLIIDTDKGEKFRLKYTQPHCHRNAHIQLNDTINFNGTRHNLQHLTAQLDDWVATRIEFKNGVANYYLNDSLVYSIPYVNEKAGRITSIAIMINSTGAVKDFSLYDDEKTYGYYRETE